MTSPLLVLSDTHLSRAYGTRTSEALAQLIVEHPRSEIVLNGDIFDLSLDAPNVPVCESLEAVLKHHQTLVEVLKSHVSSGSKLTFIPGNHDAALADTEATAFLQKRLGAKGGKHVEITPWFARRGDVHIEHGHLYDPDCATNHPLANPSARSEGLGTALMRRFCSPNDALSFAHANQVTPGSGLLQTIRQWGPRAPLIITNYFRTAISLCLEAGLHGERIARAQLQGEARLEQYAEKKGHTATILRALLILAPEPTHHSFKSTFLRLYFDRVLSGLVLLFGAALLLLAGFGSPLGLSGFLPAKAFLTGTGILLALGAGAYLALNLLKEGNRYGDLVIDQLSEAAKGVGALTKSQLVIFGHSHVEVDEPGYVNSGSFGLGGQKRPYLLVEPGGSYERHYLEIT